MIAWPTEAEVEVWLGVASHPTLRPPRRSTIVSFKPEARHEFVSPPTD